MKEFALIFRMDISTEEKQPTPEQMTAYMRDWEKWISWIADEGKLAERGSHFSRTGKVLRPNDIANDGPYEACNESVAGYINILASNIEDAVKIAKRCPILAGEGTSVEIRETAAPGK